MSTPRARILEAAVTAIAKHGYYGMSMRDLARSAGRSPASFYNHFRSKEDVLFELQTTAFRRLLESGRQAVSEAGDDRDDQLMAFIANHVTYAADHRDVMRVLVHEASALSPERRAVVRGLKEDYFDVARAILADLTGTDGPELMRATYSVFGMLNWTYGWYAPEQHGRPLDVARTIHRIAVHGLLEGEPS